MISVNHRALEMAAQDMVAKARQIKSVLDTLDADIHQDLMVWGGQAKTAYVSAKRQWDESLVEMVTHLQRAANGVDDANAEYLRTDRDNADLFQGIPRR